MKNDGYDPNRVKYGGYVIFIENEISWSLVWLELEQRNKKKDFKILATMFANVESHSKWNSLLGRENHVQDV